MHNINYQAVLTHESAKFEVIHKMTLKTGHNSKISLKKRLTQAIFCGALQEETNTKYTIQSQLVINGAYFV